MPTKDPEKLRAKRKRQNDRRRANGATAAWWAAHPDYGRQWREAHPGYVKDWLRAHPEYRRPARPLKRKARAEVSAAVQRGDLVRMPCEICGSTDRVQGHHAFGYEPEVALAVWWLCKRDHDATHRAMR